MSSLYRFFVLILSTLVVVSLINQGVASPLPDDFTPNHHAGPSQFGSTHLGPPRPQHLGPPRTGDSGIGSSGPQITYY